MALLNTETTDVWRTLALVNRDILKQVESALKSADLPPLAWYDALFEIEKAGDAGIRPFQLNDRLLLPQYGTSRLLTRIIKAGLISRVDDHADGRGQIVRITAAGRAKRAKMWPIYAAALRERVEDRLAPDEALQLTRLLKKLKHDPSD